MHPFVYLVAISLACPSASITHIWVGDPGKCIPPAPHILPSTTTPNTLAFLLVSTCTDSNRCAIACLDIPSCIVTWKAMHRIESLPIDMPFSPTAIAHITAVNTHIDAPFHIPVYRYDSSFPLNCLYAVFIIFVLAISLFHPSSIQEFTVYAILAIITQADTCTTYRNNQTYSHIINTTIAPPPADPCAPYITPVNTFSDHYAQCRAKIAVSDHAPDVAANILQHLIARSVFVDPDVLISAARVDIQRARLGANISRAYAYMAAVIGTGHTSIPYNTVRAHNVLATAHLFDHNPSIAAYHARIALSFALAQPPDNLMSLEIATSYRTLSSVYTHTDEFNMAVSYFEKMLHYQTLVFPSLN
jgi:hypothetical protein